MLVIADFFVEQIRGGGELCTEEIIKHLQQNEPNKIRRIRSHEVTERDLKGGVGNVLISNFINLPENIKQTLIASHHSTKYFIIEHDHKYCKARNPLAYPNMIVPESELQHREFYKHAQAVFCQSKAHADVLRKNLWIDNVVNLGCNLWSVEDIKSLASRLESNKNRTRKIGIMSSSNAIKGTREAIELCHSKGLDSYELIPPMPQEAFWNELAKTETIVFLPQTYETYSRFAIEAKILGCKLVTNKAIGAMSEDYWSQNGADLLNTIIKKRYEVLDLIEDVLKFNHRYWDHQKPKVSLITTVYRGEKFIEGFLDAFIAQENMKNHELIVIDANSPENESELIKPYLNRYSNIIYKKIPEKKTTMECFNIATDMATGEYIAMCMIDDRIHPNHLDTLSKQLCLRQDIDLVYGDVVVTTKANDVFSPLNKINPPLFDHSRADFSKEGMIKNLPGPVPMYRRSLHYKIGGYRNEILHGGDWEFYLRAVKNGSRFLKINKVVGLYYNNPDGLSTTADSAITKERRKSEQQIFEEYKDVFGETVYKQFKPYFDQWK